jgi:uroporphyrinogen decarboxylase
MTPNENLLKAVRFETPEWIPVEFHINPACWFHYDHTLLQELMADHPLLFPGFEPVEKVEPSLSPVQVADAPYTDPWGCTWETMQDGITGAVHQHPLADWSAFESYRAPDPEKTDGLVAVDWSARALQMQNAEKPVIASLPHGHTFLRLCDIRGYEKLIYDMMDEDIRLLKLIEMNEDFNIAVINRYIELGAEWLSYPEDLGMQVGPMISPELFRKYIKPVYQRMMQPARDKGLIVHMHSDGDIRMLADDLIDGGVEVINLQDLVNGIDWIAERFAGRVCIDLDVDRQSITPGGTPEQIDALIREEVEKLGSKEGGLTMIYGLYPGVPLENAKALMDAFERYMGYYSG